MRTSIRTLAVLLVALATAAGVALAKSSLPTIPGTSPGGAVKLEARPAQIVYTGDGSGILGGFDGVGRGKWGHLRWTKWTRQSAAGHGADWIDNCNPDCASGRYSPYPATLAVFRPRGGHFTRVTLRVRQHKRWSVTQIQIERSNGLYIYTFSPPA